jgi:hypothetical protein
MDCADVYRRRDFEGLVVCGERNYTVKKLLFISLCFFMLTRPLWAAITFVQSPSLGANFIDAAGPQTLVSSTVSFNSNTAAGDLLLCSEYAYSENGSVSVPVTLAAPTTAGFSWTLVAQETVAYGVSVYGVVALYSIPSALVMSTSVTTTTQAAIGTSITTSLGVAIYLAEFSGTTGIVDATVFNNAITSSVPTAGNITTSASDLVFVSVDSVGAPPSNGSGYSTAYSTDASYGTGKGQYQLNSAVGIVSTSFGSSCNGWAVVAAAFKPSPVVTAVPRHRGWVN